MVRLPFPQRFEASPTRMRSLAVLALVGVFIFFVGLLIAPARAWANYLLAVYYLLGISLAGVLFLALLYVTNAGWAAALKRIPEAFASMFPIVALLMLGVFVGIPQLYEWSHTDAFMHDAILQKKTAWLNVPWFVVRTVVYLGIWFFFARLIVGRKTEVGNNDGIALRAFKRKKTASAIFLVVFALSFTLASMDWIMSLEPDWYSTIFGIYNFAGMFLSGLAAITILVILLKRWGPFEHVLTSEHLHSLGKLIFAFSTFWMYIWFSQYLLIWYANIPEEVTYFVHREQGSWLIFTIVNVLFNWVIPFVALLPAWTKQHDGFLLRVCIIIMIGRWIDLFWMIMPPFMKEAPLVSVWEIAIPLGVLAFGLFVTLKQLGKRTLVPLEDPMIIESLPQYQGTLHHE